jgi:hypothetical protein
MNIIKDLRVLNAIINKSILATNNNIVIDRKYKYLTQGYIVTPVIYKGKKYISKYIDGCFYPYIVEL